MNVQRLTLVDPVEHFRPLDWQREALDAGFSTAEASRLVFWRWYVARRGDTARRVVRLGAA